MLRLIPDKPLNVIQSSPLKLLEAESSTSPTSSSVRLATFSRSHPPCPEKVNLDRTALSSTAGRHEDTIRLMTGEIRPRALGDKRAGVQDLNLLLNTATPFSYTGSSSVSVLRLALLSA